MTGKIWLGLVLAAFVGGLLVPRSSPPPQVVEKTVYVDRIVYKTQMKTRTIHKPDGTVITSSNETTVSRRDQQYQRQAVTVKNLTRYSLGLSAGVKWGADGPSKLYTFDGGYRLGDTPLWITTSISTDKSVTAGIRLEF